MWLTFTQIQAQNLPAMLETWVWSLSCKDPLEEGGLQYSCLENSCGQRSLAGYSPWGCRVRHDWACRHSPAVTSQGDCTHEYLIAEAVTFQSDLPPCTPTPVWSWGKHWTYPCCGTFYKIPECFSSELSEAISRCVDGLWKQIVP